MIAKMRKYSFLVFHKDYDEFLGKIRDLGVLHIAEKEAEVEDDTKLSELQAKKEKLNKVISRLESRVVTYNREVPDEDPEKLLRKIDEIEENIVTFEDCIQNLNKEIRIMNPWGDFSWKLIHQIEDYGRHIHFFTCPASRYLEEWEQSFNAIVIKKRGSQIFFITVNDYPEIPDLEAERLKLPKNRLAKLYTEKEEMTTVNDSLHKQLNKIAKEKLIILLQYRDKINADFDYRQAELRAERAGENKLKILEGWVPVKDEKSLVEYLKEAGVYYTARNANVNDDAPVLLKNNGFNRLFEMISDLYSRPRYSELDMTPFLAPFYLLFFGFCFSDAGYGLLFLGVATYFKSHSKKLSKGILSLIQLLGASTMFFGLLGGVFFGIELYKTNLPIYSDIAEAYGTVEMPIDKLIQDIMLKASLGLGLVQMLFGMFIKASKLIKQKGIKYAISTFGWAFLIISSIVNYFVINSNGAEFFNIPYLIVAGLCLFGIFFMNSPGKNPFFNFGAGLWDTYNTVVGGVGDLLSYVRLFALGLASAILGLVFNQLATKIVNPEAGIGALIFMYLGMTLILIVGHAINIFMSGLGSMVHPLRLTFVEFYKNAGFEGGGTPYYPFKNNKLIH